jgi:AraC-like DNA-binding protein
MMQRDRHLWGMAVFTGEKWKHEGRMSRRLLRISKEEWRGMAHAARYCVKTLAKNCGVSVSTVARHIRTKTGQGPHEWLRGMRMARAKELLADGSGVKETAGMLSYESPHHFSRDFKDACGYPPGEHAMRVQSEAIKSQRGFATREARSEPRNTRNTRNESRL